jgi:hypothetical protein
MVVCELSTSARVFYRLLAPLISGSSVLSAVVALAARPLRDKEVPPWMESFAFHAAVAAFMLGFAVWLASQISAVNASIRLEGKELHIRRFWSGRVAIRPLSDVASIAGLEIRWKDGGREWLEGRAGPGLPILLSTIPGCTSGPRPSKEA